MCLFPAIGLYRGKWDVLWKHRKSFQLLSWSWAQLLLNYVMFICILRVSAQSGVDVVLWNCTELWNLQESLERWKKVQCKVQRGLTQQLLSLCKQFLVYPFNYHLRLLSVPTLSLNPLGEGQEAASRTRSFLPPESPWGGSGGENSKILFPLWCFTSEEITVCIYESKTSSVCWILVSARHFWVSGRRSWSSKPLGNHTFIRGLIFLSSLVFILSVPPWGDPVTPLSQMWK